jgi:predicted RNase H-like HicB family nuclease
MAVGRAIISEPDPVREPNMEKELIFVVEEAPEGGYLARALGHNICTEADSYDELKEMVQDATKCHFEDREMPRLIRLRMVKDEVIPL